METAGDQRPLRVAVLGCGSVGSQVVRLLQDQSGDLAARIGAPLELAGVAVRRLDAVREVDVPPGLLTTDAGGLVFRIPRRDLEVKVHKRVNVRILELIETSSGARIELEGNRIPLTHSKDVIQALAR